jgi:hypothetical protein
MKTKNVTFLTQNVKIILGAAVITSLLCCSNVHAQKGAEKYLDKLPAGLKLKEDKPQKYLLTEKMTLLDIKGNFASKFLVTGEYTRGLANGTVCWNNVRISMAQGVQEPATKGNLIECMEGFSYSSDTKDILKQDFFKPCASDGNMSFIRTLPGCTFRFEGYAWTYFDSLQINQPKAIQVGSATIENYATVKFKGLQLIWTGVSKMNNKMCAVIRFQTALNPIETKDKNVDSSGSTLYFGTIWVSLEDKQIEYATMNEISVLELTLPGNPVKPITTLQNEVTFEKIK